MAALHDTRVVVINGARQVGKSTLAETVLRSTPDAQARYLDEPAVLDAALADPAGFVRHHGLLMIDEIQRAPGLLLAIKREVDRDPRPGRFLLTGSARLLDLKDLPDALPGRLEAIELAPLSQAEIDATRGTFPDSALDQGPDLALESGLRRGDYIRRALRGGFPEAVHRPIEGRRRRFFESYVTTLISRDIRQLSEIEKPSDLRRLLDAAAARMASLYVPDRLAKDVGVSWSLAKRYLELLELVFFIKSVPAWSSNLTRRAVGTPKLLVVDSGLAGHLTGRTEARADDAVVDHGGLIENFAMGELDRQIGWSSTYPRLYHYRNRDGVEVDGLLEYPGGEIIGIEIKSSETVRSGDFSGLVHLRERLGKRFRAGFILYAGGSTLTFGDRLRALPLEALWQG